MTDRKAAALGEYGYERVANDAYHTPAWCTEALLDNLRLPGPVWEPACGLGKMAEVLQARSYRVVCSDLADYGYRPMTPALDFLECTAALDGAQSIVTNPPFSLAESFIQKALELTEPGLGMVAMLLRHEYDTAASRRRFFKHPAFHMRITLTRRPQWVEPKAGEKSSSPRFNFAWFVWDWRSFGREPLTRWAP